MHLEFWCMARSRSAPVARVCEAKQWCISTVCCASFVCTKTADQADRLCVKREGETFWTRVVVRSAQHIHRKLSIIKVGCTTWCLASLVSMCVPLCCCTRQLRASQRNLNSPFIFRTGVALATKFTVLCAAPRGETYFFLFSLGLPIPLFSLSAMRANKENKRARQTENATPLRHPLTNIELSPLLQLSSSSLSFSKHLN